MGNIVKDFKKRTKLVDLFKRTDNKLIDDKSKTLMNFNQVYENSIYYQLKTWEDNKLIDSDINSRERDCRISMLEYDEKRYLNIKEQKQTSGNILNPLMFSFVKKNELNDINNFEFSNNEDTEDVVLKKLKYDKNKIYQYIRNSLQNLIKLSEILRMNSENETPTISSSEAQLDPDEKTISDCFEDFDGNVSMKINYIEKLTEQIISSIKGMIISETLLGADNARQLLLHELRSLSRFFIDCNQMEISNSILNLFDLIDKDEDIKVLIFKIDQIRSAIRHFNLTNRFHDFNFGYSTDKNEQQCINERMPSQSSSFVYKNRIFNKFMKWHKQISLERVNNQQVTSQNNEHQSQSNYRSHHHRNNNTTDNNNTQHFRRHSPSQSISFIQNRDGWNIENAKGISLSYRIDSTQNGPLSINVIIKSDIKCKLLYLIAILNEVELSYLWVPYMSNSKCLYNLSRVSKLVQQIYDLPWPIGQRENIMYCFGVDTLREHDCIMISCGDPQSNNGKFFGVDIPDPPPKIPREKCSYLLFILTQSEDNKEVTTMEMFSSFNVSKYVPIKLASFLIKRMTKKMYSDIANLASNFHGSSHESAYNDNIQLYSWLDRKISQFYELKQKKIE